jgi:hypothetical protein
MHICTTKLCYRTFFHYHFLSSYKNKGFRIAVMQTTTVITNYYNDQLKNDIDREERVLEGKITRQQADREEEEWQEVRQRVMCIILYAQ